MKRYLLYTCTLILLISAYPVNLFAGGENEWPRKIERGNAIVVIYQPQVESLTANSMEARAAVSVTNDEFTSPVFGAMWFDCNISTDRDDRTVQMLDMKVSAAKFPELEEGKIEKLSSFLEEEIPKWEIELSLDQLLADLDMSETALELSSGLNNAPPEIIFTTIPSVLIIVDGEPIFQEIEKTNYEKVLNTPFFIVKDKKKGKYYINGGEHWYVSDNAADWEYTGRVPKKLKEIADEALDTGEDGYAKEEALSDGESVEEPVIPEIILRTTPAELLQSDGEPDFSPIKGTSILYMTNTADDILMNIETQEYFILAAGRWYRSNSLSDGPWAFVEPDQVPEGFATIPADSDVGSVRSSVAGTQEAKEAVLENQIPQTAEVDRSEAKLELTYDGKPKFEPVGETGMKYAVNTDKSVLLIENRYYCCDNAIWFESESATGPWIVSTSVPDQVQEIPPESPVYNVKYVYIYDYSPTVVYTGYTPGYVHSYVYGGCVYYGTGYYYRPWYGVHYYPRPVTYGFNVHWNPYSGWGFSYGVSYGWMTVGWGAPYYGYWGPAGYRHGYHYGYHRGYSRGYRAGYYAGRASSSHPGRPTPYSSRSRASNNVYKNRAQGVSRTGNTHYDPKTGNQIASADRSTRPAAKPAGRDNNVYTDRDGNVYRRDGENWNRVDNSGQRPSTRESRPSTGERPSTRETRPS
ncbi:MAG: carbohydrate-binding family V/XII, partial [Bacteroidota bacterium]